MDKTLWTCITKLVAFYLFLTLNSVDAQDSLSMSLRLDSSESILKKIFFARGKPINEKKYLNMPKGIIRQYAIEFEIDSIQSAYERLCLDKNDTVAWIRFLVEKNIGDTVVFHGRLRNSSLGVFHGIDSLDRKIIIFDANGNRDFADDRTYVFSLSEKSDTIIPLKISLQYYMNGHVQDTLISLSFYPFQKVTISYPGSKVNYDLALSMFNRANFVANHIAEEFIYTFDIVPPLLENNMVGKSKPSPDSGYRMTTLDKEGKILRSTFQQLKDTVYFDNADWRMIDFDTEAVTFQKVADKIEGYQAGQSFQGFPVFFDYVTGNTKSVDLKEKYVLIDFWGTWCAPCIAAIPELMEFWEKHKDNVLLISVLYDEKEKVEEAKKIIKDNAMNWMHVWDDRKNSEWIKPMGVTTFPGFLLVGKNGKVLLNNSTPLSEIDKIISK